MPTHCDCASLLKRIKELEAKLREVPWTEKEADDVLTYVHNSTDEQLWINLRRLKRWAEKRIKEREL